MVPQFVFCKPIPVNVSLSLCTDIEISDESKELYDMIKGRVEFVHKQYGGDVYWEKIYTGILASELKKLGYITTLEEVINIFHNGDDVGCIRADLVVRGSNEFVIESKKCESYRALKQVIGYMRGLKMSYGFVIKFLENRTEVWMIFRNDDVDGVRYYGYNNVGVYLINNTGVV